MASASPRPTRKRSRARFVNDEEDDLSPQEEDPGTPSLGSLKKRKPNAAALSSGGERRWGSIGQKLSDLSGMLGLSGRSGKGNLSDVDDADELGGVKNIRHADTAGAEEERKNSTPKTATSRKATKEKRKVSRQISNPLMQQNPKANGSSKDIWEVEDSEEEIAGDDAIPVLTGQSKVPRKKSVVAPAPRPKSPEKEVKRPRGRPRKSDILKRAKANSRQETRQRMNSRNSDGAEIQDAGPLGKRKNSRMSDESPPQSDSEAEPSTAVKRRGGEKEAGTADSIKHTPKGILTPSKRKVGRPRKSVTFGHNERELDLGFKDLPNFTGRNKQQTSLIATSSSENSGEEADEVACIVCSGLSSRKGNQILLCDGCDLSVHQKCYRVPIIPEGDWYCRDCRPGSEVEVELDMADETSVARPPSNIPEIEGLESHLKRVQRILLDRLTGQKRIRLRGHDEEMQKVHQVVEQTVLAGEGNSMLVIGGRGCGKTTLVESVISEVSAVHREKFHVVRLNGFIHTDDKVALREIWRQLGREMEVEGDLATKTSNHADTLASLLALLSHPSEISEPSSGQTAKSVIFILDEFDLFTTHARQTLLYNLFDIAQARKAPIAVLGLTTRIDVVESLEKRVKSRFSHRYVFLSLPRSLPMFWEICKQGLTVAADETDMKDLGSELPGQKEFFLFWNGMIDDLHKKDDGFKHHIESCFYRSKSIPEFFTSCILPVASLSPTSLPLTSRTFLSTLSVSPPDSKLHILQGLSELELALLIAAARLDIILDTDTCNFAMAYDEYGSLTSRHKIQTSSTGIAALGSSAKFWGKEAALGAWEKLAEYELLVPAGIGGGGGRDFGIAGRMWKVDVGLEEIPGSIDRLSAVMSKWCREI